MTSLKEKHIIITGASRGIGRSLAFALHKEGAKLSLLARNLGQLQDIASKLGSNTVVYGADLTKSDEMKSALDYARQKNGPIDVLINNAGTGWYRPFGEHTEEENRSIIELNITTVTEMTRLALPDLKQQKGTVLNISSDLGTRPLPNMALYSASKHAVNGLSRSLTRELKEFDVKVLLLSPGLTDSTFGGRSDGDTPPPYGLDQDDLADVAVFMLTRPQYLLVDEVNVHPLKNDF